MLINCQVARSAVAIGNSRSSLLLGHNMLFHLGGALTMIAEANLLAFAFMFHKRLSEFPDWGEAYSKHRQCISERLSKNEKEPRNAEQDAPATLDSTRPSLPLRLVAVKRG